MTKKLSEEELNQMLVDARKVVSVGLNYQHYKGNVYQVVDLAILTEDIGVGVIYQAQYGKKILFVRPLAVWLGEVEHKGKTIKRFTEV